MSVTLDSKIEFKELCKLFEKIAKAKGSQKYQELQKFTRECHVLANKIKAQFSDADTSLFPIFRLILPNLERERGPYGLKTTTLTNLYVRVFYLGKNSANTKKLTNKKPTNDSCKNDDFAERIFWLLRDRLQNNNNNTLSIQKVNQFLDDVAKCHESNKSKDELFVHFMRNISASELKWLTRLLLKDLKLGLSQKRTFEVIHPDAEELFNVTSNLRRVCERFTNPEESDSAIKIEIFSHVKPMLLERFKIEHISKLFVDDQRYYVQTKFDGERSQLHMKDGLFKYFTRQGYDITNNTSYGETVHSGGFLTSNIAQLLNKSCRSVILDGEMMGWHKQRKSFGSKGLSYDVKKLTEKSYHQPCFVAYDILLYNDELLINKPYSERLDYLKSAFTEKEGVLMLCNSRTVSKVDQIVEIFNVSLDKDDEGIVLKKCDALYKPNVREKSGCFKIKAEYSDGLVQDLDLIILGGYYGQGRCSGIVSSFLVGVASPPTNKNGLPSEFFSLVAVRSGLSDDDLKTIQQKFKPHWRDKKPMGIFGPKSQPPDIWISPKQSLILELRATEIIKTQAYPLGYSMRFPRVLKVRLDKNWYDTCSTTEFMSLVKDKGAVQKLTKRKVTANDIDDIEEEEVPKIRKTKTSTRVHDSFMPTRIKETMRVSRLFEDKEFCVINGDSELDKSDIARILQEHSAKVVQNPGKNTFCIIVGNPETLKAQTVITSNKYDVASPAWLKRATRPENLSKIQQFYAWELFSICPTTKHKLDEMYDQYFDSFVEDIEEESYKRIMKAAEKSLDYGNELSVSEMVKMDKLLFGVAVSPFSVFRGIVGYFHNHNDIEKYSFIFMSGKVSEDLNTSVDYIFVNADVTEDTLQRYREEVKKENVTKKSTQILKSEWINDCFTNKRLFLIEDYVV